MLSPERLSLTEILKLARPWSLLAALLFFILGSGVADYLGARLAWDGFFSGLGLLLLLLLSAYYLDSFFRYNALAAAARKPGAKEAAAANGLLTLLVAITTLSAGAILTVVSINQKQLDAGGLVILGIGLGLALVYALPPFRLAQRGFGDVIAAFLIVPLAIFLAVYFQNGELHPLAVFLSFPLLLLYLSLALANGFPGYAADLKAQRMTLVITLGWQRAMNLHNLLLPLGYLTLLGFSFLGDIPWSIAWRGLLTLPLAGYQIWLMTRIAAGEKPRWRALALAALASSMVTAYLITAALWFI
jgi:1,4-dihydroxy-2-naphthoate octaprenyltransferase